MKRNNQMRLIANVIASFIGGVVGVSVLRLFGDTAMTGFTLTGLIVSFVGAVIVVAVMT